MIALGPGPEASGSVSAPVPTPAAAAETPASAKRKNPAPALISIERIDADGVFQLRDAGDITALARDIARFGQRFPLDLRLRPPDRFQIITGYRRFEALQFLQRDQVLARLHTNLTDDEALELALLDAVHSAPLTAADLSQLRSRLLTEGRLSRSAKDILERAERPNDELAPEGVGEPDEEGEEVDADELASDVTLRLGAINQDLSLLADVFADLEADKRDALLEQLRYSAELVSFLEAKR